MIETTAKARRQPIFGIGSLLIPALGLFVAWLQVPHAAEIYEALHFIAITLVGAAIGFVSGLIAFGRRERLWALPVMGLMLDGSFILYVVQTLHN